jgi:hypothetical protein
MYALAEPSGATYEDPHAADAMYAVADSRPVKGGKPHSAIDDDANQYALAEPSGINYEDPHAADRTYAVADPHPDKGYLKILPGNDDSNQYALADRNPMYGMPFLSQS